MIPRHVLPRIGRHATDFHFWDAALRWRPFSVTCFSLLRTLADLIPPPSLIIDGGANSGQFARAALETWAPSRVVAIEPNPHAADRLRRNFSSEERVDILQCALGAVSGSATLHVTTNSVSSSLLAPARHSGLTTNHVIDVDVRTLETILSGVEPARHTLLKLDLQGFEIPALEGAKAALDTVDYLLLEVAFSPSYEGEPLADKVFTYLRTQTDFELAHVVDTLAGPRGRILQADALFYRRK